MATTKTEASGHANIAAALAAFQAELPTIAKGKTGDAGTYKYAYAGIDDIHPVAMPLLGKHGLAFSSQPTLMGDAFVLQYALLFEDGEGSIEGAYPLPDPTSTLPQKLGSAITYARRYAFCAVTGIAPGGDDDDAASANDKPAAGRKPRAVKPAPVQDPHAEFVAIGEYAGRILDANTVDDLSKIAADVDLAAEMGLKFSRADKEQAWLAEVVKHFGLSLPGSQADAPIKWVLGQVRKEIESRPVAAAEDAPSEDAPAADWPVTDIPDDGEPES